MFDGLKDMGKLLKQAQEMKAKMKDVQRELKSTRLTGMAMGGKIEIVLNGEMEVLSVKISPDCLSDAAKLEKGFEEALSKVLKEAKDLATKKLSSVTGGMQIPGLTG
jgi:nucleoid-associated protein EbfC